MKKKDEIKKEQKCFKATKKVKRRIPPPQLKYVKKYFNKLYKTSLFGYGIVIIPITNMVYFYTKLNENGKECIKFWYATSIQEVISGDFVTFFLD